MIPRSLPFVGTLVKSTLFSTVCPALALAASAALFLAGCADPGPLDGDQPRTPYTQYRELRGEDPPLTSENALGETKPNLRARLLPQ